MKALTRLKINIIIDVFLFLSMIVVGAIGLILKYVLIHGSDRWLKYGDNVELTYLGLDRHQWGYVHWIASLVLIGLLVLHLVFHWKQIVCLVKRYLPAKKIRWALVGAFLLISLGLAISPFLFSIEIGDPVRGYRNEALPGGQTDEGRAYRDGNFRLEYNEEVLRNRDAGSRHSTKPDEGLSRVEGARRVDNDTTRREYSGERRGIAGQHTGRQSDLDIQGLYTIAEVAEKYEVADTKLKEMLGIPATVSNNERLGRLRRTYGFSMSEVERCVLKLQEKN